MLAVVTCLFAMPNVSQMPIPIARGGDGLDRSPDEASIPQRTGSSGSYLGVSAGLGGSSSLRESMAVSFGKDVAEYVHQHVWY